MVKKTRIIDLTAAGLPPQPILDGCGYAVVEDIVRDGVLSVEDLTIADPASLDAVFNYFKEAEVDAGHRGLLNAFVVDDDGSTREDLVEAINLYGFDLSVVATRSSYMRGVPDRVMLQSISRK